MGNNDLWAKVGIPNSLRDFLRISFTCEKESCLGVTYHVCLKRRGALLALNHYLSKGINNPCADIECDQGFDIQSSFDQELQDCGLSMSELKSKVLAGDKHRRDINRGRVLKVQGKSRN